MISARPVRTWPLRSAPASPRSDPSPSGAAAGVRSVHTIRPTPISAIVQKTSSKPARSASTPITGPSSAPAIAAPMAEPISCPRFSRGAAPASQAIAPAQEAAPPMPWMNRDTSSTRIVPANATAMLESTISASPSSTVGFTPNLRREDAARQPARERPERVRGGEDAGARLGQAELVREVGQQRRERRVERRVDEDDGGDEEKELAHWTSADPRSRPARPSCG